MGKGTDWGTATWKYWQGIVNALPARDRPNRPPVPVRTRIVWSVDGEEWLDGEAERLDPGRAIYVRLHDRRCSLLGAWLHPDDVWWKGK